MQHSASAGENPPWLGGPGGDTSDVVPDTFDVGGHDNRTAGDGVSHVSVGADRAGHAGPSDEEEPSSAAQLSEEQVRAQPHQCWQHSRNRSRVRRCHPRQSRIN